MHNYWPLSFWYFNSIINDNNFLYFRRGCEKNKATFALCTLVMSTGGQHGNEAKVGRCCDICETQKGE